MFLHCQSCPLGTPVFPKMGEFPKNSKGGGGLISDLNCFFLQIFGIINSSFGPEFQGKLAT